MLVMGFGSSAPEFVVSIIAATDGNSGLALGNAIGSNISNIGLILGITAILSPIAVRSSVLSTELPILLFVTMVATLLIGLDASLDRGDGWIMIALFAFVMIWTIQVGLQTQRDQLASEVEEALEDLMTLTRAIVYLVGGLIILVLSSRLLVWGGVNLAQILGLSDALIGLTIVALGTSLPELAACIVAVRRNEHDLAIGNVIGSNLFNTTLVIGTAGAILPTGIEPDMIARDIPILVAFTLLLFASCYSFGRKQPIIRRTEAAAFLGCYIAYYAFLFYRVLSP
jgi:cation:H+ antiporter